MLIDDPFKQVFNAAPMGMAIIDRNHRVLLTNPAMDRINGRRAGPGEPVDRVAPHIAETLRAYVDAVFQTRTAPETVSLPGRPEGNGGTSSHLRCDFTPIAADTGARVELCLAVMTDLGAGQLDTAGSEIAPPPLGAAPDPAVLTKSDA